MVWRKEVEQNGTGKVGRDPDNMSRGNLPHFTTILQSTAPMSNRLNRLVTGPLQERVDKHCPRSNTQGAGCRSRFAPPGTS